MTQEAALQILKTGANVFLTGEPGAGKTYTISSYVSYLRDHGIEPAITASTGIAATHIGGMTIHSWSGIGIKKTLSPYEVDKLASTERIGKRIVHTKVLIIDEISMLDGSTLSLVDRVCKAVKNSVEPFGGMQVIFVGDFFQLPPITKQESADSEDRLFDDEPQSPFAFDSALWKQMSPVVCYLSEQHRQSDELFLDILSAIRSGTFDVMHQERLDQRIIEGTNVDPEITKLFPHNEHVDSMNSAKLATLASEEHIFRMESSGKENMVEALKRGCLSPETLVLKVGAKVMFTKNNFDEHFVNGTQGEVIGFDPLYDLPLVKTTSGHTITVKKMEWALEEQGKVLARISQIPLRLSWAMTVHKSQGVSLDSAYIDLRQAFVAGQGYVALSRVRTLDGLYLAGYNQASLMVHPLVLKQDLLFRKSSESAEQAFADLDGEELSEMHRNFIIASGGSIEKQPRRKLALETKKKTQSGAAATKELLLEGKGIREIASERSLTTGTIMKHIEDLLEKKTISVDDIKHLKKGKEKEVEKILTAFRKSGDRKLTPVHELLKGEYSFDDLRFVRLFLT